MGTYTVNFVRQNPMKVYCTSICTGKCYIAETQRNSEIQVMRDSTCYKVFSISHNFAADLKQIKIVNHEQCMIAGLVKYHGEQRTTMFSVDTGAMCNVVSELILCEIFQIRAINSEDLQHTEASLKTADNSALRCRGQISLNIKVGRNEAEMPFFVISSGNVFLLGVPAIEKLNMVIDLPNSRCYLLGFTDKKVVNNITCEKDGETQGSSIRHNGPKHRLDTCPENYVIRLTPARQYSVNNLNPLKIKLEMVGEIRTCFLYKKK